MFHTAVNDKLSDATILDLSTLPIILTSQSNIGATEENGEQDLGGAYVDTSKQNKETIKEIK